MSKLQPNIKENNKWVLCPSKRLPGQYYYFNVATGEAVWCTSDAKGPENAEKNAAAKQQNTNTQIQEECTRTFSNTNSDTIRIFNRPTNTPTFGKVSFPNYVPIERDKPTTSNTPIFDISSSLRTFRNTTPIVSQMPMIVLPLQFMLDPKVSPTSKQVTQISDLETVLLVHSCQMPLSKRFGNYENVVPTTSDEVTSNINPTKPIKTVDSAVGPIVGSTNDIKKSILREPVLNVKNNEVEAISVNLNVEKAKENSHDDNLTLADLNLNDSAIESQQEEEERDKSVKLQKDDLRLFLIARKRRYKEDDVNRNSSEVKKIKLRRADHVEKPARKHVTFNLDNGVISSPQYSQNIFPDSNTKFSMPILKPALSTAIKEWYIAVDTNILIENYEFINNFVLADENCRLLIPESSRRQIETWCSAASFGCRNMFTVRQVAWLLKNPPRHVVVGSQTEAKSILFFSDTNMAAYDTLLNCCLEKMNKKHKVVLLSDDEDLLRNAQSLRIQSYKFRYIKESVRKCTDILDLNFKCNHLLNSIDSQPTVSLNKELFAKSHSLFQNFTGFNMPAYKNNPFDDQSIESKMSSHISPVAQNINIKNNFRANIIQTNEGHKCQNLFEIQNRDLNSNICSNNPFFFQKSCFDKDVNKGSVKTFQIQNSVPFENQNSNKAFEGNANEIQFQIQNLKSKQVVLPKSNQTTKMEASSSNTPNNNENEDFLEINLKRFEIKNKVMEVRIKERIEEWTCTFRQIMEDALSNVLQISSFQNDLILPWSLLEMIERVNKIYDDATLKIIVNKLIACMAECVCDDVKVKKSVKLQDFVKVIGCGILFMQRLQSIQANCDGLANAKQSLMNLWRTIEDPNEIESVESSHYIHVDIENRHNYVKGPSEIINYLKRHYENWNSYEMSEDQNNTKTNSQNIKIINEIATTTQEDAKIFRTVGKNLRTLRIDSNKSISVAKCQNNPKSTFRKVVDNVITKDVTSTKKVSEHPNSDVINKTNKNTGANEKGPKAKENSSKEPIVNKIDNKISTELDTRHIRLVKKIEKGVKAKTALNMDVINISDIETENNEHTLNVKDGTNFNKNTNDSKYNDVKLNIVETIRKIDDSGKTKPELSDYGKVMAEINDFSNNKDDIVKKDITISVSTSDSGIENESYMTYSYIKKFLCELSSILIAIHSFIVENLDDLQKIKNDDEKKSNLHKKVTNVRKYLTSIIGQLKSIVQRETSGATLNNLMIEIEEAANDKRISRYRSVIRKFLEQARILQNALKIILCVTENKEDTYTICSDSTGSSFRYINIFE